MELQKNRNLIIFMILAMISLMALQAYWIKNAIQVQNEQFDRNVKTAIIETVRKIEQQEVNYIAQQRILALQQNPLLNPIPLPTTDSTFKEEALNRSYNEAFLQEFSKKLENIGEKIPENKEKASEYINERLLKDNDQLNAYIENHQQIESKFRDIQDLNDWVDSTQNFEPSLFSANEIFAPQLNLDIIKGIINELILGHRKLSERISPNRVENLLKAELSNVGIQTPFQFSIEENGQVVFDSQGNYSPNNAYRIRLFPRDSSHKNQFLNVTFPNRDNFIFKNLTFLLSISALLILLVGGIFYYSASSLFNERRLAKVKSDFINNMTHELKTPVSSIGLALEVIQDPAVEKTPQKTQRYLGIIKEENQRLAHQIDRVLQMARLEQNQVTLNLEKLSVHDSLATVIHNFEVRTPENSIQLVSNAPNDIIWGDEVHLTNIWYNLLDNALKYSPDKVNIKITTSNPNAQHIQIEVQDQGLGIAELDQNRIFETFYRVPTGNIHNVKGFGLGLSYVKNMVELHKGNIKVQSQLNQGSTFIITLPLA